MARNSKNDQDISIWISLFIIPGVCETPEVNKAGKCVPQHVFHVQLHTLLNNNHNKYISRVFEVHTSFSDWTRTENKSCRNKSSKRSKMEPFKNNDADLAGFGFIRYLNWRPDQSRLRYSSPKVTTYLFWRVNKTLSKYF